MYAPFPLTQSIPVISYWTWDLIQHHAVPQHTNIVVYPYFSLQRGEEVEQQLMYLSVLLRTSHFARCLPAVSCN